MSKNPVQTTPLSKSYTYFDENFNQVTKDIDVQFDEATNLSDSRVVSVLADESKHLKAINSHLRREKLAEEKAKVKGAGISSAAVMNFLRPFRETPPYNDKKVYPTRKSQTEALLEGVRGSTFMMNAIRAASAQIDAETESESEETEA
jgi:hypothetical protein